MDLSIDVCPNCLPKPSFLYLSIDIEHLSIDHAPILNFHLSKSLNSLLRPLIHSHSIKTLQFIHIPQSSYTCTPLYDQCLDKKPQILGLTTYCHEKLPKCHDIGFHILNTFIISLKSPKIYYRFKFIHYAHKHILNLFSSHKK